MSLELTVDGARDDWKDLFLASAGRIARVPFLIAVAMLVVAKALYEAVPGRLFHWIAGWFVYPLLVFAAASVLSRRLHDRGRSGWWSAVILLGVVVVWPYRTGLAEAPFWLALAWAAVDLGLLPGQPLANRYGPSPRNPPLAA